MFRFKVVDGEGKVLGIRNKLWEAEKVYRDNYQKRPRIIALTTENADEDFKGITEG